MLFTSEKDALHCSAGCLLALYTGLLVTAAVMTRLLVVGSGAAFFRFRAPPRHRTAGTIVSSEERRCRPAVASDSTMTMPSSPSLQGQVGRELFRDAQPASSSHSLYKVLLWATTHGATLTPPSSLFGPSEGSATLHRRDQMLQLLTEDCCALPVSAAHTTVLYQPCDFYQRLCHLITTSKHQVTLCALYIGDGPLARALIQTIVQRAERAIREAEASGATGTVFHIRVVMDYHRMRDRRNIESLQPLLSLAHSEIRSVKVEAFLYQHPSTWTRRLYPFGRVAEALGVQHAKIFSTDEENVLLTGANLSDDYFTTRTDRYLLVQHNPHVGKWFNAAVKAIADVSHPVMEEMTWRLHETTRVSSDQALGVEPVERPPIVEEPRGFWNKLHFTLFPPDLFGVGQPSLSTNRSSTASHRPRLAAPMRHGKSGLLLLPNVCGADPARETDRYRQLERQRLLGFALEMRDAFSGLAEKVFGTPVEEGEGDGAVYDTVMFPTLQCGPAGIFHDSAVVEALLRQTTAADHVYLTSPYMNLYASYMDVMLHDSEAQLDCITASVTANGWHSVKGASFIPLCYLQLERVFYYVAKEWGCADRVRVREFAKPGLTFHSKGIWLFSREERAKSASTAAEVDGEPYLVGFGSSNYGYRSVHRDMEVAMMLFTVSDTLRAALRKDLQLLLEQSGEPVKDEQFIGNALGRFQPVISLLAQLGQGYL